MIKSNGVTLIADAGSTKTEWILMEKSGQIISRAKTDGINAATASAEQLEDYLITAKLLMIAKPYLPPYPEYIYYYGAGCASEDICNNVSRAIDQVWFSRLSFMSRVIYVASDMLGACRALLGKEPGVACILGTGSNSALYDGEKIIANTPPLGYILGDEGSGAAIGKRFISDIFKGCAPEHVTKDFIKETGMTKDEVIRRVYREPNANRFLASFAPYIAVHMEDEYFDKMVQSQFDAFIERNLLNYPDVENLPVSFIGSIAQHFNSQLEQSLSRFNLKLATVIASPMEGLITYHSNH